MRCARLQLRVVLLSGIAFGVATGVPAQGLDGPGVRTETVKLRFQGQGFGAHSIEIPLENKVPLEGVTFVHVDAMVLEFSGTGGEYGANTTVTLTSEGVPVGTIANAGGQGFGTWSRTVRLGQNLPDRSVTADGIRVQLSNTNVSGASSLNTTVFGMHDEDVVKIHFIYGSFRGPHAVRALAPGAEQTLQGPGTTTWATTNFGEAVPAQNLKFLFHSDFGGWNWCCLNVGTMSESQFLLDDGSVLPLDDAFSPSTGETVFNRMSACHSRLLDDEMRRDLRDRSIVGWQWRVVRSDGDDGQTTITPAGSMQAFFVYEYDDCNGNSVPDGEDLASGESSDCDGNGVPDECDPDCDRNGIPDVCDLTAGVSVDCNANGIPDGCEVSPSLDIVLGVSEAERLEVGNRPLALATGDLDGDGSLDLAVGNNSSRNVSVLLNPGNDGGPPAVLLELSDRPDALTATDLDDDGDLDLAVALGRADIVSLLLNDGEGNFSQGKELAVVDRPVDVVSGDLDGDGDFDLIVAARDSDRVAILINSGRGNFASAANYDVGNAPESVVVVDFDGDGDLDWAVRYRSEKTVTVGFNQGDGTFSDVSNVELEVRTDEIVAVDVDIDGDMDIAVLAREEIHFLENNGDGTFATGAEGSILALEGRGLDMAFADLNGDGREEIIVSSGNQTGRISTLLNLGTDGYASQTRWSFGISPATLAARDFNGDGQIDLAVTDFHAGVVWIVLNATSSNSSADCDGNGVPDTCDIESGNAADENQNGIPDSCDGSRFIRGDSTADGEVGLGDAVRTLNFLFTGNVDLDCPKSADADSNGGLNISDPVFVLKFLFDGGAAPAAPFPDCGREAEGQGEPDSLTCEAFAACP